MTRIGLVGLGGMGTVHWNNYKYIDGCTVVAAVGNSESDKRNAEAWNIPLYPDIDQMLDRHEVDVVDVCTPTFLHFQHGMKSLSRGVNTFIEKPIALHKKDAMTLYDTAKANNALLFVGQAVRFTKASEILRELVRTEQYGKPLDASFERLSYIPRWAAGGWMFDRNKSGQLAFDLHIHDLDLIVSVFGKPLRYSYTCAGSKTRDFKEQYRFTYQYDGFNISAEAAWFNADIPFTARWRVYFENALVVYDGSVMKAYPAGHEPVVFDTSETRKIPTGINVPPTEMFLNELSHFIACVRENKSSERIKKEEVLSVLEILEDVTFPK